MHFHRCYANSKHLFHYRDIIAGSTLYGYTRRPITLECPGFINYTDSDLPTLQWNMCQSDNLDKCRDIWMLVGLLEYWPPSKTWSSSPDTSKDSRIDVSHTTGAMTIQSFGKKDEGWYRCDATGIVPVPIQLLTYGTNNISNPLTNKILL